MAKLTMGWKSIETKNENLLIRSPKGEVFYAKPDGQYVRGVDDPEEEWEWALEEWDDIEISEVEPDVVESLEAQLQYMV